MSSIIAALIILVAVIIFGVILTKKNKSSGAKTSTSANAAPAAPAVSAKQQQQAEFRNIMDSLIKLNLLLRKDPLLSADLRDKIEGIIDDLTAVIPSMMERYPGETLTYEIKKIGGSHLFKTVKEYLDLSQESREKQADTFLATIDSLHDVSHRSREIVEKNETAEFKTMASFLASKFS